MAGEYETASSGKRRVGYRAYILGIMVLVHFTAQLDTYALVSTNRSMGAELRYGSQICVLYNQSLLNTTTNCTALPIHQCTDEGCRLQHTGLGTEYDLLAGPFYIILNSVVGMFLGILLEMLKGNRKNILGACVFLWSLMTLLCSLAGAYWHVAITRIGLGIFAGGCVPLATSILADYFSKGRGSALALFNWGVYMGFGLSIALVSVNNAIGWRYVYVIAGSPGILLAALVVFTVKEPITAKLPLMLGFIPSRTRELANSLRLFWDPLLLLLCLGGAIRNGGGYVWAYYLNPFTNKYHPGVKVEDYMSWIPPTCGTIGSLLGGFVSDKLSARYGPPGRIYVLITGQILAVPFVLLTLLLDTDWALLMQMPSYVFGETWIGVCVATVVDMVPVINKTSAVAVYMFIITVIGGNLNILVTPIANASNLRTALVVMYPGVYALSVVIFSVVLCLMKRKQYKHQGSVHEQEVDENTGLFQREND